MPGSTAPDTPDDIGTAIARPWLKTAHTQFRSLRPESAAQMGRGGPAMHDPASGDPVDNPAPLGGDLRDALAFDDIECLTGTAIDFVTQLAAIVDRACGNRAGMADLHVSARLLAGICRAAEASLGESTRLAERRIAEARRDEADALIAADARAEVIRLGLADQAASFLHQRHANSNVA